MTGVSFDKLYNQVALILDQQVNNTVAKEMLISATAIDVTKTELLHVHLRDGAVNILKRWPEMKSKLHMFLNLHLPHKLQSTAWTLFMSDSSGRILCQPFHHQHVRCPSCYQMAMLKFLMLSWFNL